MPGFDGTGPRGRGPMTGRGMGSCGRGYRRGYGRRNSRGFFNRTFGGFFGNRTVTDDEEKKVLQEEAEILKKELNEVKSRLEDLEK